MLVLASELESKGACVVRAASPWAVVGIHAGDGPSLNPKLWPCEDSAALHALPDGRLLAAVADAHFGGAAGEAVVRGLRDAWEATSGGPALRLEATLRRLEGSWHAERPEGDRSATTALLVLLDGRRVDWVHAGDSHLLTISRGRCEARAAHARGFLGDGACCELERGQFELAPEELLLLASDGLDRPMSNLEPIDVGAALDPAHGPLEKRVAALLRRAGSAQRGGGRDNLAVVALEPGRRTVS